MHFADRGEIIMKYRRKVLYYSKRICPITALCFTVLSLLAAVICKGENSLSIIFGAWAFCFAYCHFLEIIVVSLSYTYTNEYIVLSCLSIKYRKIRYSKFKRIVISNAAFNNFSGGVFVDIPMQYKVGKKQKITYPFITLHKENDTADKLKSGLSSRDLLYIGDRSDLFFLGICWFDSLKDILHYTDLPVYVLEDVYLRFKGMFDMIFKDYLNDKKRFNIVTDKNIEYEKYLQMVG